MNCLICGKAFKAKPCHVQSGRAKYCSRDCASVARDTKVQIKCEVCGNIRFVKKSEFEKKNSRFCSQKCAGLYATEHGTRKNGFPRNCGICGKELYVQPNQEANGRGRFCSNQCRAWYLAKIFRREKSVKWKGGIRVDKDGYVYIKVDKKPGALNGYIKRATLVRLGEKRTPQGYVVHHDNEIKDDDRPENLILMPRIEHNRLHKQIGRKQ